MEKSVHIMESYVLGFINSKADDAMYENKRKSKEVR